MLRIAEEVGVVEATLALQSLWIDGEPPPITEIENVPMVNVSMKRDHFAWIGKKHTRGFGATVECFAFGRAMSA